MSDSPRRFWQIHISTAVITFLFAVTLLALNTVFPAGTVRILHSGKLPGFVNGAADVPGFPMTCVSVYDDGSHVIDQELFAWNMAICLTLSGAACFVIERTVVRTCAPLRESSPGRKFWQVHLSTLIALMFVAAGYLYLNFRHGYIQSYGAVNSQSGISIWEGNSMGWPFPFLIQPTTVSVGYHPQPIQHPTWEFNPPPFPWAGWAIVIDIAFGLFVILAAGIVIERRMRRQSIPLTKIDQ